MLSRLFVLRDSGQNQWWVSRSSQTLLSTRTFYNTHHAGPDLMDAALLPAFSTGDARYQSMKGFRNGKDALVNWGERAWSWPATAIRVGEVVEGNPQSLRGDEEAVESLAIEHLRLFKHKR